MYKTFIKEDKIKAFQVEDNKVHTTIAWQGLWVTNPSLELFYSVGWSDYTPEPDPPLTNDQIRQLRELAYRDRSDSFFIATQKYLALGEEEKAAEAKQKWLEEIDLIDKEYPYVSDDTETQEQDNTGDDLSDNE